MLSKMNGRGQVISFALIPLMALVFSIVALFVMASYEGNFEGDSQKNNEMILNLKFNEEYVFKKAEMGLKEAAKFECSKDKFREEPLKVGVVIIGTENFIGKVERGEFSLFKNEINNRCILDIRDLFFYSKSGENEIKKNLNIHLEFTG